MESISLTTVKDSLWTCSRAEIFKTKVGKGLGRLLSSQPCYTLMKLGIDRTSGSMTSGMAK